MLELDAVDRITVGAVGEPGHRTFYLQARQGDLMVTVIVEKQQVELLSASVVDILTRLGKEVEESPELPMDLEEPLIPEWRVGRLALGYAEDRDMVLLEAEELLPEDEEEEAEAAQVRFWATREQMLALARHGAEVCAAGRPTCELCGGPIDPEGHLCPALNGHGELD